MDSFPTSKMNSTSSTPSSCITSSFYSSHISSTSCDNPKSIPCESELQEPFPVRDLPNHLLVAANQLPLDTTVSMTYYDILTSSTLALPCFLETLTTASSLSTSSFTSWHPIYQERFLKFYLYMPHYQKYNNYFDNTSTVHQKILDQCCEVSQVPFQYPFPSWYTRTLRLFSRKEVNSGFFGQHLTILPYLCEWILQTHAEFKSNSNQPHTLSVSPTSLKTNLLPHPKKLATSTTETPTAATEAAPTPTTPCENTLKGNRPTSPLSPQTSPTPSSLSSATSLNPTAWDTLHIFATLANFALVEQNQQRLVEHHVASLLSQSLHDYQESKDMVPELLAAFSNLVFYPEALQELTSDTPHYVLRLLEQNVLERGWLLHGLHVLSVMNKAFLGTPLRTFFLKLLKKTLQLYPYDDGMMYACLSTLGNFFANDGTIPDPTFFKAMNTVIHRFEHQVDVLVGAVFAIAQMFNCLSATEIANYADLIDVGYLVQVASNHATHESFQTTLCFLWSVMARCPSLRPSFYHHSILKLIQQAMVTEFESNLHQHHHVFLGSNLLQFTKNEMLKLFASVTIMHLADVVSDQPKLLENRCLDTLIQCMHQVENRKQLSFLMQFILQRLVKNLDSPVVYLIPPYPPKLTDLTRFHLTSFLLCSRCQSKYPEIQCYAVCKQTGQWIGGLPQQYKLCRTCISLDRHQYGFVRHQGQGKVWTVSLST